MTEPAQPPTTVLDEYDDLCARARMTDCPTCDGERIMPSRWRYDWSVGRPAPEQCTTCNGTGAVPVEDDE
jgi:DnaJ-class molecular chaperone